MAGSIFSIGLTGLNAAQAGLLVTSHNIANANTTGYHRQSTVQTTPIPENEGEGFLGRGTVVSTVDRAYSQFLDNAVLQSQAQQSYLQAYNDQISQVDNLLADPTAGLTPALQGFFSAVQDVANNPADVPSRQALISGAQSLISGFSTIQGRLADIQGGVNTQISDSVSTINTLGSQIANLNTQIIAASATASQAPNDLLDQRDNLVNQLNQVVRANVVKENNGSYDVFIGAGQTLVVGNQATTLLAQPAADDPQNTTVLAKTALGSLPIDPKALQGGTLGGLLSFQSGVLNSTENQLGRVAVVLGTTFNAQHKLGQDLNGNIGQNFFNVPAPQVNASSGNTGTATIGATISDAGALTGSDYTLGFDGTNYSLQRMSDNTVTTIAPGSLPATVDGVTISLSSGTPAAGDQFLIEPTRNAAQNLGLAITDPKLIAAAAPIQTAAGAANTGQGSISAGVVVDTTNAAFATPGQLTPPVLIKFTSPTSYDIYDNTNPAAPALIQGGNAYTAGASNAVFPTSGGTDYGYRVSLTGAAAAGDTFTVGANVGGVADSRNALLLAGLQTQNTVQASTSYQGAYSQMVAAVGTNAQQVSVQLDAQNSLVQQTQAAQQSYSGVNMDEEAANLIKYQQAYQASAKVLQIASTLFNSILTLGQ